MTQEYVIDAKELARECVEKVMPEADGEYKEQLIRGCLEYLHTAGFLNWQIMIADTPFTKQ